MKVSLILMIGQALGGASPVVVGDTFDVRLPSPSTEGGTLALRVTAPETPRYGSGSPVLVEVPGGWGVGSLRGSTTLVDHGVSVVRFLFPGGEERGISSDGEFDYRGAHCNRAVADVLEFALGRREDASGSTLDEIVGGGLDLDVVGVGALSNGGPVTTAALGRFGSQLSGLDFFVGWENPTSDQTLAMDFGPRDCDPRDGDRNGDSGDDHRTDAYRGYGFPDCVFDLSDLAWDPSGRWRAGKGEHVGTFYLERTGNDRYDTVERDRCLSGDLDDSSRLEPYEDQLLQAVVLDDPSLPRYPSLAVLNAAMELGLFEELGWPDSVATLSEARHFWFHHDATYHYAAIAENLPDLKGMLVSSGVDHVQITVDHVHIRNAYDGFRDHDLWCRLNPDALYSSRLAPTHALNEMPDNPANLVVSDWTVDRGLKIPDSFPVDLAFTAAVLEMVDRTHRGDWSLNLNMGKAVVAPRR